MKYCCGALLFALVSSCSVSAQVPSSDELIQMAASEAGQKKIFAELKKVATSWDDWPHHDDVHKAMLGHYLAIAENPKAAVADRVTALRGIQNSRIHWLSEESAEKKRVDALKSGLMAESNPRDVRLSAFLLFNEHHVFDEFASASAQRKFLVAGLKSTKFEHLRSICVSRVTWGAYSSRSLSDYQSAADVLAGIAADPNDWLAEKSLSELKHVTSLVPDLVPQLVTQFDAFDRQREIVKFLGDCGSHPKYSLQLLWRLFAKQSQRYDKEHALIAIAKITRTNDLNVTRVIQAVGPLMSMDDWHPQYATDEICGILGEKAAPLVQPLLRWLRQQEDVSADDFSAVARCFGNIGPAAREGALVLKDETDRFEGYELKEFLRHLAEAGTGQDFVPVAMKYIDDPDLRYSVIESLSVVGSAADDCVPKLIELIDDEDVKPAALEAIMMMGKRGREAGDKLKSLVRQGEDNRAALALMALFPEERETVLMAHAAKLYVGPDEAEKLKASMTPEEFESLKRTISQKLNGENGKERAAVDVKITITKATFGTSKKKSDVTQAIQAFVDEKVSVRRTAKGFGVNDPKPGVMKRLTVNYTINGKEYSKRFACGPSRPRINLSEALRPDDLVSATAGGPPEVEKVGKSVWRLKPHLTIGIPEPGFEWKLASADPVVYECRSEGRDIWMTVTPMPTMNDFSIARQKVIEDYRTDVALKLKTAGAEFEDGVDYFTHYGDDSIRGLTAVMFHYRNGGVEYTRFIGRVFRSAGSYQFETSAPRSRADDMIGLVRFADLDVDAITRTPVPENIRQEISAELVKLEELFDMKTEADVERMISHVLGDQQLGQMKASGQFNRFVDHALKEAGPVTLRAIKAADWQLSELGGNGGVVTFRVPPYGLAFVQANGKWRLRLR